jgi:CheY-like chemotaxis protein
MGRWKGMSKLIRPTLTALVVYNVPSMCWFLARRLKDMGFNSVIATRDADKAMNRLRLATTNGITINLIIADVNLPKSGGALFIKLLREHPAYRKTPVVLLGNFNQFNSGEIDRHLEDIICVLNPIDSKDFQEKVQEALFKSHG